jgi:hypothetical protein
MLEQGSWQETMVAQCRTKLAVIPHSARAVLFYSQHPNGETDNDSHHGGCPVLKKEKWAANLWVWNAPRGGFPGAPMNEEVVARNKKKNVGAKPTGPQQLHATFSNTGIDPAFTTASLYFQETFWGNLGKNDPPLSVNTYEGHQWNIIVDDKVKRTIVINTEPNQSYEV